MSNFKLIPLTPNNFTLDGGHMPPAAVDLEEAVLGAVLIEEQGLHDALEKIRHPEYFYKNAHSHIWQAILDVHGRGAIPECLTVTEQLKRNGTLEAVGGAYALIQLTNKVGSAANVEHHAAIVAEKYIQRALIKAGMDMVYRSYRDDVDPFEALSTAAAYLDAINNQVSGRSRKVFSQVVEEVGNELINQAKNPEVLLGTPTGIQALDRQLNGWQKTDLVILAARPAMGKTAFALGCAIHAAKQYVQHNTGKPYRERKAVGFISLEMSDKQLIRRQLAQQAGLSVNEIIRGNLSEHTYQRIANAIAETAVLPFMLCDEGGIDIIRLRALIIDWVRRHGVQEVYLDYLQLVTVLGSRSGGNREQDVSTISRTLKALAKQLNITIIALCQLSRAVETRGGDKIPILSDLRESGSIEQDADIVIFLYRAEYYGIEVYEDGNPTKGRADAIIAKYRAGHPGPVPMRFNARLTQFTDLDAPEPDYREPPPKTFHSKLGYTDYSQPSSQKEVKDEDLPF